MGFLADDITHDRFLGGRLTLAQPRRGYRAGVDPVLLAASVPAKPGESVLDLGCGVGAAALCLGRRVAGLRLTGVERQADYAALARDNAARNGLDFTVHTADLTDLPETVRAESFDHVIMNPPYYLAQHATKSADSGRAGALFEETPLALWIEVATRRLTPGGLLTVIQKAERLQGVLAALPDRLGSVLVQPLASRPGRDASLVLLRARKGGRSAFRLAAPILMHAGDAHLTDGDDYRPKISAVLRAGAPLETG